MRDQRVSLGKLRKAVHIYYNTKCTADDGAVICRKCDALIAFRVKTLQAKLANPIGLATPQGSWKLDVCVPYCPECRDEAISLQDITTIVI